MHPEAAFLSGYALTLVAVAALLVSFGRRSTEPWASRMLAASRPPDEHPIGPEERNWPHSEVPVFHAGVSGVILIAALVLTTVSVFRHHRPLELAVHLGLLTLIALRIGHVLDSVTGFGRRRSRSP